jgi:hypothetical protein
LAALCALPVFDADRAFAFKQDAGGLRVGLDAQIGAGCHMRMDIGPRGAPAFAVFLRHLIEAEALVILGVEILTDPKLCFAGSLQKCLLHRIFGAQSVDGERAALAVIVAAEIGIVFRALEVGQHVGERPAGVAQRRPLVVIAAVAADIDHGVDCGGTAEPLAARLIADPAIEACLRHRVESPVVELARHHQRQRPRRGDHPVVPHAAGFQQRHRRLGILGEPAGDRAAARAAAHHDKIACIRHAYPPEVLMKFLYCPGAPAELLRCHRHHRAVPWYFTRFSCSKAGLLRSFWQERPGGLDLALQMRVLTVIKSEKIVRGPFQSRSALVHTARTQGAFARVAFSGSLRTGSIGALRRWPNSFRRRFFARRAMVYRGVEQPGSSSGS